MRGIIDRFEGDYAVVEMEDKTMMDITLKLLPEGVREGSTIEVSGSDIQLIDTGDKLSDEVSQLMDELWT